MNLASIIDAHDSDNVALIGRRRSTTYGELRAQVAACRGGLAELGIGDGDRVALLLGNSRRFVVSYLAILGRGAIAVPLNPTSPAPEVRDQINAVGAKAVVLDQVSSPTWSNLERAAVPTIEVEIKTDGTDGGPGSPMAFDDLISADPVDIVDVDPDHLAALLFTSGTAGSPKAAMLTHDNLLSNIDQASGSSAQVNETDVIFGLLPAFHIMGLNVVLGMGLLRGATIVLVQRFDPATAVQTIVDRQVTVLPGAPGVWKAFAHFDELDPDTFASVRVALSGAARLPVTVAETMRDRFGVIIREGYGLTEASPIVTTMVGSEVRFGSVGRALGGVEVRLVNADGDALVGDVGEIWVRGRNVFAGYWQDPDATADVINDDGWLMTGDMATTDDDGYLYLVDRSKDLIIVSGFNVYPAEVEEILMTHPDVLEAGVVGVAHPNTGEAVKAFVVTTADSDLDEDALVDYSHDRLARYKCPSKIIFVDELPRNTHGKLVRRNLDESLRVGA